MKIIFLTLSILVFFGAGYVLITDFTPALEMNNILYISLLVVLMLICIVGVLYNFPFLVKQRRNVKTIIYNSYSNKRILNKEFDRRYGIMS